MWKCLWIVLAATAVSACQALPSRPDFRTELVLPRTAGADGKSDAYTTPQVASGVVQVEPKSCSSPSGSTDLEKRNNCIIDLMTDIDDAYSSYEIAVNNKISGTNAVLSVAQNAFSLSGAGTTGDTAKALTSLGTFTGGVKTAISDDLLYKTSLQILISTMRADRAKQAAQLRVNMLLPVGQYTMNTAKNDLLAYFYSGTLVHALAEANDNAATTAKTCQTADAVVKEAVKQPNAKAKAPAKPDSAAAAAATTSTTADDCKKVAASITFKGDNGETATTLFGLLAPGGAYDKGVEAVLNTCVKATTPPAGMSMAQYTLPNGAPDLGSLIADSAIDADYKAQLLACTKAGIAKQQAAAAAAPAPAAAPPPPDGGAKPAKPAKPNHG